ncbi:hypothetical protein [Mucilaginibacter sp. KACC 22063]|uniref:hypothetical protein n=1 Tax=Mucilaginibacter sp. KACC 22063 TaxID=3025666 RepID=UPI00236631C0|nr:hypothetical protein [Mucilaginibacter sp. KACC 22063]WDF54389.1 hypothetical protein PQ461_15710 [Mucilaginibacter sp. KACC 22063]
MLQIICGCNNEPAKATNAPVHKSAVVNSERVKTTDEQLFRSFLAGFKRAVKANNKTILKAMFYFPLQTNPQWSNEDLKNSHIDPKTGLINSAEFDSYYQDIFTKDAIRLIPVSKEDDLSEIDKTTTEDYYKTLIPLTDKGSTLYELTKQYTQDNGQETSFGFVFGKIKGSYKVISYYRPWPLKG